VSKIEFALPTAEAKIISNKSTHKTGLSSEVSSTRGANREKKEQSELDALMSQLEALK